MRGDSGVTNSDRVWRKVPKSKGGAGKREVPESERCRKAREVPESEGGTGKRGLECGFAARVTPPNLSATT